MNKVELYNHNKTTYENITKIFAKENKCAVVQPTGSGKSFLIFKLAQDNPDKNIVVLEPNKQIIGRVSEQMKDYNITNLNFLTYQKLNSDYKKGEFSIDSVDIICLDELHRITAREWNKAIVAIQEKLPNAKILGLTATPERSDGQNIVEYFGAELACEITLGDAIVNKILPCPTYISALYTFDEEVDKISKQIDESRNSDEEKSEMRNELEAARRNLEKSMGVPTILTKHIPNKNGKYLVFCSNVEHLNTMRPLIEDWFTQAGFETHIYTVHTKYSNRNKEYKEFKNDTSDCIKLCLCVDMFNEGVHLEGITGVILFRPTQSNIIYFQQIGRALTTSDKNTPIIFDLVNNGNSLGATNIRAEIENAIERQKEDSVDSNTDEIFSIDDFHIYDYVGDSLNIFQSIHDKCVDEFNFRLQQLKEYKEKWGHCCVMKNEAEEWDGLNEWAKVQRYHLKHDYMSLNRINILNQCGFVWDTDEWNFNKIVERIKQYIADGNHLPIPYGYVCKDGYNLGLKITHYKRNKENGILKPNVEKTLVDLGINIEFKKFDKRWKEYYDICYEWVCVLNNKIKQGVNYKGYNIGNWLNAQKVKFRKNELSPDKIEMLKEICDLDSHRDKSNEMIWDKKYNLLKEYLISNKNITQRTKYNGVNLGSWYSTQLTLYNQGKLRKDRVEKLVLLRDNLLQSKNEIKWNKFVDILTECLQNNIQITSKTLYKNVKVGEILSGYRERYKKETLPDTEERYQQLLELGIDLAKEGSLM